MQNEKCAYCEDGERVNALGIKVMDLPTSRVYLFREQSHRGRVIVVSKSHVSEIVDLSRRDRQAFMDDVAAVAAAIHRAFGPATVNYGAYGDIGGHLHFHLVPKYAGESFEWGDVFAMDPKRTILTDAECADLVAQLRAELYVGPGFDLRKALGDMRRDIVAVGKVDFAETTVLLKALAPLEGSGATIDAFIRELREVRADKVVTEEESARIRQLLDEVLA